MESMNSEHNDAVCCHLCGKQITSINGRQVASTIVEQRIRGRLFIFCSDECKIAFQKTQALPNLYCTAIALVTLIVGFPIIQLGVYQASFNELSSYFVLLPVLLFGLVLILAAIRHITKIAEIRREINTIRNNISS